MEKKQKEMIATLVKEGRLLKGYTQKELSERSNISIRSIQRIENGEIIPRSYTLKTIAEVIGTPFEAFTKITMGENISADEIGFIETRKTTSSTITVTQRIILSSGLCAIVLILAAAYIAQSSSFPETNFEMFIFSAVVLVTLTGILFFLWRNKK